MEDGFGNSLAISGDTTLRERAADSTAASPNDNATWAGAAYVFMRSGDYLDTAGLSEASNEGSVDIFGWSVTISGDTTVVGAYLEDASLSEDRCGRPGDPGGRSLSTGELIHNNFYSVFLKNILP